MSTSNEQSNQPNKTSTKPEFNPLLYNFRVAPRVGCRKSFALQQPFATLFDNLIAVLWSVYGKNSKIHIGVHQLQWALEFLKCMKVDFGYPGAIENIVDDLEDQLIKLYAKIGEKIHDNMLKTEDELLKQRSKEQSSKSSVEENSSSKIYKSYNEEDILGKLDGLKITIDPITGEAKYLKELNALGKKKKMKDPCDDKKTYMIGALQKILNNTSDKEAKTGVEQLIKELRVETSPK